MKELRQILDAIATGVVDESTVLATVIDVRGSSYRLPGARMLILANGETVGIISGGCLEADVLEHAKQVLKTQRSTVLTYDTRGDHDSVFSMNMGCRGVIRILLEPISRESVLINRLLAVDHARAKLTIATVVSTDSAKNESIGGRAFYDARSGFRTSGLPPFLATLSQLHDACSGFFVSNEVCISQTFGLKEGTFEFILENIEPPISLRLFGAGADAAPMVQIVTEVGWQVRVHDHRPAFLTGDRFPMAQELILQNLEEPLSSSLFDERTAVVIMTHNYLRDRSLLPAVLHSSAFYIGALGPKTRTERLLEEILSNGSVLSDDQLTRLYAPAGLDIGADTPETIALSIVGEIQSVLTHRDGGYLRNRQGPIYDRR